MYPFGGIIIAPIMSGYFASVTCRLMRRMGYRPSDIITLLAIVFGVIMAWVSTFQMDLFSLHQTNGKVPLSIELLLCGVPSGFLGLFPASIVVARHQRIYDKTHQKY